MSSDLWVHHRNLIHNVDFLKPHTKSCGQPNVYSKSFRQQLWFSSQLREGDVAELVEAEGGELAVVSVVVVRAAAAVAGLERDARAAVEARVGAAGVEGELAAVALVARPTEAEEVVAVPVLLASPAAEARVRGAHVAPLLLAPFPSPVVGNRNIEVGTTRLTYTRRYTKAPEKIHMHVLLSNSQAGSGRNFSQPRTSLFRGRCTRICILGMT